MGKSRNRLLVGLALVTAAASACSSDDEGATTTQAAVTTQPAAAASAPTTTAAPDATAAPAPTAAPAATAAPTATTAAPAPTAAPTASDAAPAGGGEFTIAEFEFPAGFTATAGEEFTITNADGFGHTVTSDDFDVEVGANGSETLTIDAPGTYRIICKIHPQMSGEIVVE